MGLMRTKVRDWVIGRFADAMSVDLKRNWMSTTSKWVTKLRTPRSKTKWSPMWRTMIRLVSDSMPRPLLLEPNVDHRVRASQQSAPRGVNVPVAVSDRIQKVLPDDPVANQHPDATPVQVDPAKRVGPLLMIQPPLAGAVPPLRRTPHRSRRNSAMSRRGKKRSLS